MAQRANNSIIGSANVNRQGGSPNRKRNSNNQNQRLPIRPFLKDLGEIAYGRQGGNSFSFVGDSTSGSIEGYIQMRDEDMEMLADFEEEQYRKGHFELLFPLARTLDNYRGFVGHQRRANQVLWAYVKQGQPVHHLVNYFKNI